MPSVCPAPVPEMGSNQVQILHYCTEVHFEGRHFFGGKGQNKNKKRLERLRKNLLKSLKNMFRKNVLKGFANILLYKVSKYIFLFFTKYFYKKVWKGKKNSSKKKL